MCLICLTERVRLFQQLVQWEPALPQLGHEAAEGYETPHESLNVLDISDLAHFSDGQDLVRVCFDAVLSDDVPQELAPGDSKGSLLRLQLDVELPEVVEGFL
jgi:hypothetical protein